MQALDLMGRKTVRVKGGLLDILFGEIDEFVASQIDAQSMKPYLDALQTCRDRLAEATSIVLARSGEDPNEIGAASYSYMELMGLTLYCFMWARILAAVIGARSTAGFDESYADSLVKIGEFFMQRLLPRGESLLAEIASGAETLMAMDAEQF